MQLSRAVWLLYDPGAHGLYAVEPVAHAAPAGHDVQFSAWERPIALEYVPAKHGRAADAPGGQKLPMVHCSQAVEPL